MAPPRVPKIVAGTMAATFALTAGVAIAADGGSTPEDPKLDDVVLVRDVAQNEITTTTVTMPDADDSMESPFDTMMSVESVQSMESVDSVESMESVDSVESMESPESMESVDSVESMESPESMESVDSADSADSP